MHLVKIRQITKSHRRIRRTLLLNWNPYLGCYGFHLQSSVAWKWAWTCWMDRHFVRVSTLLSVRVPCRERCRCRVNPLVLRCTFGWIETSTRSLGRTGVFLKKKRVQITISNISNKQLSCFFQHTWPMKIIHRSEFDGHGGGSMWEAYHSILVCPHLS